MVFRIVGWVEAQSADTHRAGTMGIAELVLSKVEGLHPSYAGIVTQETAGNSTLRIERFEAYESFAATPPALIS
jgi:hypothetical protein